LEKKRFDSKIQKRKNSIPKSEMVKKIGKEKV